MPVELLVGAVVGAGLASEPVRKSLRKGLVYGLAGALIAYDKVSGLASHVRVGKKSTVTPEAAPGPKTAASPETNGAAPPDAADAQHANATSH